MLWGECETGVSLGNSCLQSQFQLTGGGWGLEGRRYWGWSQKDQVHNSKEKERKKGAEIIIKQQKKVVFSEVSIHLGIRWVACQDLTFHGVKI